MSTTTETYNWKFLFLGAGIDAVGESRKVGVKFDQTLSHDREKTTSAIKLVAKKLRDYRTTGLESSLAYTVRERKSLK